MPLASQLPHIKRIGAHSSAGGPTPPRLAAMGDGTALHNPEVHSHGCARRRLALEGRLAVEWGQGFV